MDKTSIAPVRRLLPYEVVLCRELGISRDEYLEFLVEQKRSSQITFGGPTMIAVEALIGIILAVIGLIFQVVALLLRPQPPKPEGARREQRFSPTFGFNSVQELAKYGDPINLIYTSRTQNPAGGVRVNTSLVWSNVLSFGSSQFYQALTVLGSGTVIAIDATKSGFGQSLISQQPSSRTWQYYRNGSTTVTNGLANLPVTADRINDNTATDPGLGSTYVYEVRNGAAATTEGFSQAFSPTAAASIGVYAPIPINMTVRVDNPNNSGGVDRQECNLGITASIQWSSSQSVSVGTTLDITIAATPINLANEYQNAGNDAQIAAFETRTAAAQGINAGVIYRLGSAEWEFVDYLTNGSGQRCTDPVDGDVVIRLRCSRAGKFPSTPYTTTTYSENGWAYTKALVRQERAEYKTLNECDIVDFAMRGKVYRRINGRSKPRYSVGQNGYRNRQSFFRLEFKLRSSSTYTVVPGIFAVRRAVDADNFFFLKFAAPSRNLYDFRFVPIIDLPAESGVYDNVLATNTPDFITTHTGRLVTTSASSDSVYYLSNGGDYQGIAVGGFTIYYQGPVGRIADLPDDSPPVCNEWDLFSLDSFTSYSLSSDSGPELSLNVVNEQQLEADYADHQTLYDRLSVLGVNLYSGKNIQDVRQISAFVTEGRKVRRISTTTNTWPEEPDGASCYAPDIFLDTLLDSLDGVGSLVPEEAVNADSLVAAKRFCERNSLFFDCVIADNSNWRSFWAEKAPYSLLEFTRINGKEGLIPAVPVDSEGNITRTLTISGFFNESNILEGSYREEYLDYGDNTKDLEATVIYRTLDEKAFPVQMSVIVQRSDATNPTRQSFDLSGYVTTKAQAVMFAKLLCNIRRYQQRGVEFKTYGTAVGPGDYIRVETTMQQWDTVYTGRVGDGGTLQFLQTPTDGTYTVLLYRSGQPSVSTSVTLSGGAGAVLAEYLGWLFVLGNPSTTQRIFRIAETNTDEDGVITIKATEYPVDSNNRALIPDFSSDLFTVTG